MYMTLERKPNPRVCHACGARVKTRAQWLAEKCPAFKDGKSGHLISAPGKLR